MKRQFVIFTLSLFIITGCKKEKQQSEEAVVFSSSGDINAQLTTFKNKLGVLNTTIGVTGGRREVNWDAVPDSLMGLKLPGDFFNPTEAGAPVARQRGLLYAGSNDAVVSKTNFSETNAQAATEFASFSGNKTFAVINALEWPVGFRVAGQTTSATINAFGAVFIDVDKSNSTSLEFFSGTQSLGKYFVPQQAGSKFSFLGVYFPTQKITQVKIAHEGMLSSGEKDISQGGSKDLVVLDDFIYSEPVAQ
jgi:hypothetical protein